MKNGQFSDTVNIGCTWHRTKTNKTNTTQITKRMSNTDPTKIRGWTTNPTKTQGRTTNPTKIRGWTQVLTKLKQFMPLIRHMPCYSYSQNVLYTTMRKQTQMTYIRHELPTKTIINQLCQLYAGDKILLN